ncbi:MltA domain-containing protein [Hyphococcus flavus]|uniref:peptidoglycan lytic exotransglycosylase n=1 Tax=Hyphococcus flavus TaxID=1866326 RepID=A0AAF0CGY3_9PROT|nr:MltA domain-containing protein [Hyphococcus flavus]WDI32803.1 MltA domain-containing protein [Hyphococcus flavus]
MSLLSGMKLRLMLAGALALAGVSAVIVFSGVLPPYYEREFSDEDFGPATFDFEFVDFASLDGWRQDDPSLALDAFVRSCAVFEARDPEATANPLENLGEAYSHITLAGVNADWLRPCAEARALTVSAYGDPAVRRAALRSFFEFHFQPVAIKTRREPLPDGKASRAAPRVEAKGVFTGYFEPVYEASREPTASHTAPVYPRPDDLIEVDLGQFREELRGERIAGRVEGRRLTPYADHSEINAGVLGDTLQPIAWTDPNDLFFLQIQGSGRFVFPDGETVRVGYDGQNGHAYTAIGRIMVQQNIMALEDITMQSIRDWLDREASEKAQAMREENASYVFFKPLEELSADLGPLGAQGVPLTPGRSVAVDRRYHTLGAPIWVNIEPVPEAGETPIRRLMIAQDTGGAIRGPVRGDVFWGSGDEAAKIAGAMNAQGQMTVLLPRRLAERWQEPSHMATARRNTQ